MVKRTPTARVNLFANHRGTEEHDIVLGVAAGYRERLFAKISDHYVDRRTQNFLRAISPYNLPRRPVHPLELAGLKEESGLSDI